MVANAEATDPIAMREGHWSAPCPARQLLKLKKRGPAASLYGERYSIPYRITRIRRNVEGVRQTIPQRASKSRCIKPQPGIPWLEWFTTRIQGACRLALNHGRLRFILTIIRCLGHLEGKLGQEPVHEDAQRISRATLTMASLLILFRCLYWRSSPPIVDGHQLLSRRASTLGSWPGLRLPPKLVALTTASENDAAREWITHFTKQSIPKSAVELTYSRSSGPGGQVFNPFISLHRMLERLTFRCSG